MDTEATSMSAREAVKGTTPEDRNRYAIGLELENLTQLEPRSSYIDAVVDAFRGHVLPRSWRYFQFEDGGRNFPQSAG